VASQRRSWQGHGGGSGDSQWSVAWLEDGSSTRDIGG
jgi:hypothetical protein